MMRWDRLLLLMLLLSWPAQITRAKEIHVNNVTGNDINRGQQPNYTGDGGPVRTLWKALRLADSGDQVVLANSGQPYRECITLIGSHHSGLLANRFTIIGNGAVLDGSKSIPPHCWEHIVGDVFRFHPPRSSFQQLFIDDRPVTRVLAEPGRSPIGQLQAREWSLFEGQIYFRVEPDKSVYQYQLSCCGHPIGITLYRVQQVTIADLTVQGFQLDGVHAHDGVDDCALVGVTCRGNGRSGVAIAGTSKLQLDNCIVGDNGFAQLLTQGTSVTQLLESAILPKSAPPIVRQGGEVFGLAESDDK